MNKKDTESKTKQEVCDWWATKIIEMEPGVIRYHGYPIEQLIGNISFSQMIWLMLKKELPNPAQTKLFDAALMSAVDHGPQAPSIAIARMAMTCGIDINNAMASAINVLGNVHGGAGEQAMEIYHSIAQKVQEGQEMEETVIQFINDFFAAGNKYLPGFGHRFHPVDPRAPRLLQLVRQASKKKEVSGLFAQIAQTIEKQLQQKKKKLIPMNIDGATAVIYAELGFPTTLTRGLFCLSRSVGILAHSHEQANQSERNKGPIPKQYIWTYQGKKPRKFDKGKQKKDTQATHK